VHLDVPVNGYRWFRGFNDYDNWQASGVSGQGARSFYYPATPQKCADCHMPLVSSTDPAAKGGKVRSHRFPAANTALPFVNHDQVQLKTVQDFMRDGQISVDVFGISRTAETPATGTGPTLPAAEPRLSSTFAVGEESGAFAPAASGSKFTTMRPEWRFIAWTCCGVGCALTMAVFLISLSVTLVEQTNSLAVWQIHQLARHWAGVPSIPLRCAGRQHQNGAFLVYS
jgi:hypothetical protein